MGTSGRLNIVAASAISGVAGSGGFAIAASVVSILGGCVTASPQPDANVIAKISRINTLVFCSVSFRQLFIVGLLDESLVNVIRIILFLVVQGERYNTFQNKL